jgi:hypothetical protein
LQGLVRRALASMVRQVRLATAHVRRLRPMLDAADRRADARESCKYRRVQELVRVPHPTLAHQMRVAELMRRMQPLRLAPPAAAAVGSTAAAAPALPPHRDARAQR